MKWEHAVVSLDGKCAGGTCLTEEWLKASGDRHWELVTIYNDVAYFKRPKEDHGQEEEEEKTVQTEKDTDQEDSHQPKGCKNPGKLYTKAYAHCFDEEGSS